MNTDYILLGQLNAVTEALHALHQTLVHPRLRQRLQAAAARPEENLAASATGADDDSDGTSVPTRFPRNHFLRHIEALIDAIDDLQGGLCDVFHEPLLSLHHADMALEPHHKMREAFVPHIDKTYHRHPPPQPADDDLNDPIPF